MPYVEMTKIVFSLMFPLPNMAVDNGFGSAVQQDEGTQGRVPQHECHGLSGTLQLPNGHYLHGGHTPRRLNDRLGQCQPCHHAELIMYNYSQQLSVRL